MSTAVSIPVTVEFEDVDAYGIAHHTRLVAYLERARLRLLFDDAGVGLAGVAMPVIYSLETRFHRPGRLLDQLQVSAELHEADAWTLRLRYQVRRGAEVLVRARSVVAFAAPEGGLVPIPAPVRARLGLAPEGRAS